MSRNSSPRPPQPLPTPRSAPSASRIGWGASSNAPPPPPPTPPPPPPPASGTFRQQDRRERVVERARAVAAHLSDTGLVRGDVVAVIGHNSGAYLVTWMAT